MKMTQLIHIPHRTKYVNVGILNDQGSFEMVSINVVNTNQYFGLAIVTPDGKTIGKLDENRTQVVITFIHNNKKYLIHAVKDKLYIVIQLNELCDM